MQPSLLPPTLTTAWSVRQQVLALQAQSHTFDLVQKHAALSTIIIGRKTETKEMVPKLVIPTCIADTRLNCKRCWSESFL